VKAARWAEDAPAPGVRVPALHNWRMHQISITAAGAIDTFLVLLIGVGPRLALVPFLEITASLDAATKARVQRKMLVTAATVAVILMALGELLRALLHFTVGSLSIAGGVILFVLAVAMVLGQPGNGGHLDAAKDLMQLARSRWPRPTCSTRCCVREELGEAPAMLGRAVRGACRQARDSWLIHW
jgi:MarC family integral membrane protein